MNRIIASLLIAGSIVGGIGAVQAEPLGGRAVADAARLGFITPGGVFDGH